MFNFCQDFAELLEFFEIDAAQYHTAPSQVPRSMICAKSLYTARSQWPFLKTFVQVFKGTVSQKKYGFMFNS